MSRRNPPPLFAPGGKALVLPRMSLAELIHVGGLVREACDRLDLCVLVTARRLASHVRHVFHGVDNLRFRFVESWADAAPEIRRWEAEGLAVVPLPSYRDSCPYAVAGMDRRLSRSRFRVVEDRDGRQMALLAAVRRAVGRDADYVVVHDEPGRELRSDLVPDMPRVHARDFPDATPFDWIRAMDHAAQIHAIDSHFLQLADKLDLRPRKYCHAYVTQGPGRWIAGAYGRDVVMIFGNDG